MLQDNEQNQENSGHSPFAHLLLSLALKHRIYIGLIIIIN